MIDSFVAYTPLLLLPVVALLGFIGCDRVFGLDHVDLPKPGPTGLMATPGDSKVVLTWDAYADATAYTIHRGESSGQYTFAVTPPGTQTTYTDPSVTNGTTYFYVVTARVAGEDTANSEEQTATPMAAALISFVTSVVLQTLQNYTGWVGMQLTVGANPITVKTLGRMFAPNNNQPHIIKIADATGVDIPNAFATVNMATGTDGQFVYAPIAQPIVLDAGTTYLIVSQETMNMDLFYHHTPDLHTTDAAVVDTSVRGGPPYSSDLAGSHCYGPLSFQY